MIEYYTIAFQTAKLNYFFSTTNILDANIEKVKNGHLGHDRFNVEERHRATMKVHGKYFIHEIREKKNKTR